MLRKRTSLSWRGKIAQRLQQIIVQPVRTLGLKVQLDTTTNSSSSRLPISIQQVGEKGWISQRIIVEKHCHLALRYVYPLVARIGESVTCLRKTPYSPDILRSSALERPRLCIGEN